MMKTKNQLGFNCNKVSFFFWGILFLFISSCKKDERTEAKEKISAVPAIELVSIAPTSINEFDEVVITIKYTDGDGDLGFEDADDNSIYVTDNRAGIVNEFHLGPIAPIGQEITIEGNLPITLENVLLLNSNQNSEEANFSIQIKDRAGNLSNVVTTGNITIQP
jgi:hypothetical protein